MLCNFFKHHAPFNVCKMMQNNLHGMLVLLFSGTLVFSACGNNQSADTPRDAGTGAAATQETGKKTILFFGNSLTAGYGLDPSEAFPALIQQKIDSLELPYTVVNAGVSGETSSGGSERIEWILRQPVDVFVLELGANDGLRGVPVAETKKNLQTIIDRVQTKNPGAVLVLAGMQVPPNMGPAYSKDFRDMFPQLAQENNMILVPFLLEGVGGERDLNQADGIHPTAEGHKVLALTIWQHLKPALTNQPG